MDQFMSNLVCEGFSSCSTEIYGHENAEMQKRKFDDVTLQNSIVEFEEWLIASIIQVGEVWKLFYGLQNKLRIALLFIMKDLNGPITSWYGRMS